MTDAAPRVQITYPTRAHGSDVRRRAEGRVVARCSPTVLVALDQPICHPGPTHIHRVVRHEGDVTWLDVPTQ